MVRPVVFVRSTFADHVVGDSVPFLRKIFTFGSCDPITGAQVESFEREEDMLKAWQTFLIESDPDIVTGYNLTQFDIPYLLNRAHALNLDGFAYLGRVKGDDTLIQAFFLLSQLMIIRFSTSSKSRATKSFHLSWL